MQRVGSLPIIIVGDELFPELIVLRHYGIRGNNTQMEPKVENDHRQHY